METTAPSDEKIQEALDLLTQAAREKKDEIRTLILEKYGDLRSTLSFVEGEVSGHVQGATELVRDLQHRGKEKARELAQEVDHRVHESPWTSLGFATVGALVIGYLLGKKD